MAARCIPPSAAIHPRQQQRSACAVIGSSRQILPQLRGTTTSALHDCAAVASAHVISPPPVPAVIANPPYVAIRCSSVKRGRYYRRLAPSRVAPSAAGEMKKAQKREAESLICQCSVARHADCFGTNSATPARPNITAARRLIEEAAPTAVRRKTAGRNAFHPLLRCA